MTKGEGTIAARKTFLWLRKSGDGSKDGYCKLCHAAIVSRLGNLENYENTD